MLLERVGLLAAILTLLAGAAVDAKRSRRQSSLESILGGGGGGDDSDLADGHLDKGNVCRMCKTAVSLVKFLLSKNKAENEILALGSSICTGLKMMTEKICDGLLRTNGPPLLHIIKASDLGADDLCRFIVKNDCGEAEGRRYGWSVVLSEERDTPPATKHPGLKDAARPLKVLHISDTHFDPGYTVGVPDECLQPLCCGVESTSAADNASVSGMWGGWKCDIPERTLDEALNHIKSEHPDIDYVVWTGDVPPHDSWSLDKAESLRILNKTVAKLLAAFPKVPIYPALGNHEVVPPNLFPTKERVDERWSVDWLYEVLIDEWSNWIPSATMPTVRRGAFYSLTIRPGLRIVSLNTNFCYYGNWWLILDDVDPAGQLNWLVEILEEAEELGDKVHIIGHIPPGHSDCLDNWQANYYGIIERYRATVAAQFFGHTHTDEFELFYDSNDSPVSVAYVAPSLTTYTYLNPAYRIYYVDGDHKETTRAVLDHETWYMDLEESNNLRVASWRKLYSAKEAYGMTDLGPRSWHGVYERLASDRDLFDTYDRFFWRDSPKRTKCGQACRKERLCEIRSCARYPTPDRGPRDETNGTEEASSSATTTTTTTTTTARATTAAAAAAAKPLRKATPRVVNYDFSNHGSSMLFIRKSAKN